MAIVIGLAIAAVVMVNLRDLREYKRFLKDLNNIKQVNWSNVNPEFKNPRKSFHLQEEQGIPMNKFWTKNICTTEFGVSELCAKLKKFTMYFEIYTRNVYFPNDAI